MNPKDWKDAMHNEAGAVSDDNWAQETEQAARLFGWRGYLPGFLVAFGCAVAFAGWDILATVAAYRVTWNVDQNALGTAITSARPLYSLFIFFAVVLSSFYFGRAQIQPLAVALAFGLIPTLIFLFCLYATIPVSFLNNGHQYFADLAYAPFDFQRAIVSICAAALTYAGALLGQRSRQRIRNTGPLT